MNLTSPHLLEKTNKSVDGLSVTSLHVSYILNSLKFFLLKIQKGRCALGGLFRREKL